jgi:hypothetical protein
MAQRVTGPFARLFGARPETDHTQSLDFGGSLGAGYDTNLTVTGEDFEAFGTPTRVKGLTEGLTADLSYDRRGDRLHFNLAGSTVLRGARPDTPVWVPVRSRDFVSAAYDAAATMDARVRRNLVVDGTGRISYAPYFQLTQFIDTSATSDPSLGGYQFAVRSQRNRTLTGAVGITSEFTRQSRLRGSLSWTGARFPERSDRDLGSWAGQAGFTHRMTRSWSLGLGAGHEQIRYSLGRQASLINDNVSVGIDYGDESLRSRRLAVSVSGRLASLRQDGLTKYRFEGDARVSRGFGRTWHSALEYSRGTDVAAGIAAPLFSDSVSASVNGLMTARVHLFSRFNASRGAAGFSEPRPFKAYIASSKLTVALTRSLAVYGQSTYYYYELPAGLTALELGSQLSRHRVMAGISWWLPLATETRVPLDPR